MQKVILFMVAIVVSIATCSQTAGTRQAGRDAFETRQSVFFEDGTLDEFTTSDWNASYTHINNQTRFSASGAMLEQVEFSYHEDRGYLQTRITRDVESRLRNRVVFQYNSQGLLWRESLVDNRGRVVTTYEFDYDSRGNRTSRIIRNRAGDLLAETSFTFNAQNRLTSSETRDSGGALISSTRFQYDPQGNLIAQQVTNGEGAVTSNIRSVWQNGLEMRNETRGARDDLHMRVTNDYGQDGELVRRVIENIQGASTQIMRFEYVFRTARR